MKQNLFIIGAILAMAPNALAFPPAPDHTLFGTVRDEQGRPLDSGEASVVVSGSAGQIARTPSDPSRGRGINYSVRIPMDAGTTATLFKPTALKPTMPFTMKVVIRGVTYLPIQMAGKVWNIGNAASRTRLDLTLGVDTDGDGIPDSWEQNLIDSDPEGRLTGLADVKPGDDLDKDGLTNLQEYQLGTYALEKLDGLTLDIVENKDGQAKLRFPVVAGRSYQLKTSTDLKTWAVEPLKLNAAADTTTQPWVRATETTLLDVWVPANGRKSLQFRLHAE